MGNGSTAPTGSAALAVGPTASTGLDTTSTTPADDPAAGMGVRRSIIGPFYPGTNVPIPVNPPTNVPLPVNPSTANPQSSNPPTGNALAQQALTGMAGYRQSNPLITALELAFTNALSPVGERIMNSLCRRDLRRVRASSKFIKDYGDEKWQIRSLGAHCNEQYVAGPNLQLAWCDHGSPSYEGEIRLCERSDQPGHVNRLNHNVCRRCLENASDRRSFHESIAFYRRSRAVCAHCCSIMQRKYKNDHDGCTCRADIAGTWKCRECCLEAFQAGDDQADDNIVRLQHTHRGQAKAKKSKYSKGPKGTVDMNAPARRITVCPRCKKSVYDTTQVWAQICMTCYGEKVTHDYDGEE